MMQWVLWLAALDRALSCFYWATLGAWVLWVTFSSIERWRASRAFERNLDAELERFRAQLLERNEQTRHELVASFEAKADRAMAELRVRQAPPEDEQH